MTTKDASDILPWHIAHDLEDAGALMIPESLYWFVKDLLEENEHFADLIQDIREIIG